MDPYRQGDLLRRASALAASAEHLPRHFADTIFPSTSIRFSDRMLSNARQYLRGIVADIERTLCTIAIKDLQFPADAFAMIGREDITSCHDLLERAMLLQEPHLLRHVFTEIQMIELQARLLQKISQDELEATLTRHLDSDDGAVADAAMAMLVAQSRSMASSGVARAHIADLEAEVLHGLTWLVAAALARVTSTDAQKLVPAAERLLASHDESEALKSRAQRLAYLLHRSEQAAIEPPHPLQDGLHLFLARMAQNSGLSMGQLALFTAEPDMVRLTVVMRALDWPVQHALSVFAALSSGEELLTAATYNETDKAHSARLVEHWAAPEGLQSAQRALAGVQGVDVDR